MALSLSNFLYIASLISFVKLSSTATITYDFTAEWVTRNPDGLHERPVIGINGQWPIPRIEATVGDRLIVNLNNQLGNESTSLHFHGLFMNGTNEMDGVVGVTQCGVPPGSNFTYNFTVDQPGSYWYHSHINGQYPDGLRGPLIIHDPQSPYADQYDEELVLTLSDWYHDEMPGLIEKFINVANPTGAEPVPNSALMNDTQNLQIMIQPGKTYFIHIINIGAFAGQYFWIEGHTFRIVEVDGVWHEAADTNMIYVTAAQRYGILLTTKNETDTNYAIVGAMDHSLFDKVPASLNPNVTSYLMYNPTAPLPTPALREGYSPFDDMALVPTDGEKLFESPDQSIILNLKMGNLGNGANYAFFNNITYVRPVVPSLYTALTTDEFATNSVVYGVNTNSFILGYNQVVEIVVNNHDTGRHPFHLHGHNFQAVARGDNHVGDYDPTNVTLPAVPMRRDTLMVRPKGYIVMRFRSDNPGVWLFHCHIEWHVDSGLVATMVEAPLELQQRLTIPPDHYSVCAASSPPMPTAGNAAANTVDFLDLTGANLSPAPLPAGFTPRGIVALVFSAVTGVLGLLAVAWYGMGEMSQIETAKSTRHVEERVALTGLDGGPASEPTSKGDGTTVIVEK